MRSQAPAGRARQTEEVVGSLWLETGLVSGWSRHGEPLRAPATVVVASAENERRAATRAATTTTGAAVTGRVAAPPGVIPAAPMRHERSGRRKRLDASSTVKVEGMDHIHAREPVFMHDERTSSSENIVPSDSRICLPRRRRAGVPGAERMTPEGQLRAAGGGVGNRGAGRAIDGKEEGARALDVV